MVYYVYRLRKGQRAMANRKTFDVVKFTDFVNQALLRDSLSEDVKDGLCHALEFVLHETGNYKGYNHRTADGKWVAPEVVRGEIHDPTFQEYRRCYYLPQNLRP